MPLHFFFFLGANAINYLVIAMLSVALGWHIYQSTGNPFHLALVGLMQVTPVFVFFFATGWIVDTFARKKILTCCALVDAVILVALTGVMLAETLNLFVLFALLFAHGSVMALYFPASQAIIPNIVPEAQIRRAIAFSSTVNNIAQTGGPLLAGLLIAAINFHIYAVMTGLMILSVLSYQLLPRLPRITPTPRSWEHIIGGLKFVRSNSIVLGAIALDLFIVLLGSVVTLLPIYAADILMIGPEQLGLLRGMPAFGAVFVGLLLASLPEMRGCGIKLFFALFIFGVSIVVFGLSTNFWLSMAALFIYGAADMVSVNIRLSLIQIATPDHLRGRVSAVNGIFISSSNEMGDVRAGSMAALLGPVGAVVIGGVMAIGVAIGGGLVFGKLRSLDKVNDAAPTLTSQKA
ncbi:MAG: MFS transporter [Proteobacteria bacterium]|nr:MFS transporter [Pseudomonadota bacterium]MDA1152395.1 MFS transporter [Pseudomonadota bacterium]